MSRHLKIGDVVPFPADCDIELGRRAARRHGILARVAGSRSQTERAKAARLIVAGLAENERRRTCPIETAKTFLRSKGYIVYDRAILGETGFVVGRRKLDSIAELHALATRLGWAG